MIPKYFIQIEKMPLTQNGKVDKRVLPVHLINNVSFNITGRPADEKENMLLDIWKNVLEINSIDVNDDFFDVGGDSLLTIKVVMEAAKKGFNFSIRDLYNYPTIRELSKKIKYSNYSEVI